MSLAHQVAILYTAGQGHLDDVPLERVKPFEHAFHGFLDARYADVLHEIERTKELPDGAAKKLDEAAKTFKAQFLAAPART
jgi:F-type H+-transporting ATPase subunit alpha